MAKKYIVDLNEDEVSQLQAIIKKGKHKARTITRANILLMAAEGETDQAISLAQLERMLRQYNGYGKNLSLVG
ncbi:hypothetical protein LC613_39870 [Nostoc sphaeroides CHAB 2801]|uniref:hypothetical protein n=1 Tax=Nostoc sphaeroides TaxID=446679 RepID=UPI001E57535C|nr:hypothetical protein [Nostoc sphaeroides]MCC5633600.1 hypothetical protein [Nostoc sphaeroides CHAB 2801]